MDLTQLPDFMKYKMDLLKKYLVLLSVRVLN